MDERSHPHRFPHNYVGTTFKPLPGIHEMAAKLKARNEKAAAAKAREDEPNPQSENAGMLQCTLFSAILFGALGGCGPSGLGMPVNKTYTSSARRHGDARCSSVAGALQRGLFDLILTPGFLGVPMADVVWSYPSGLDNRRRTLHTTTTSW